MTHCTTCPNPTITEDSEPTSWICPICKAMHVLLQTEHGLMWFRVQPVIVASLVNNRTGQKVELASIPLDIAMDKFKGDAK